MALEDTFTDADGTEIQNHTSDSGHRWLAREGLGWVINGALAAGPGPAVLEVDQDFDLSDYTIAVTLSIEAADANNPGVLFRKEDAENFYRFSFSGGPPCDTWTLTRVKYGVETDLDTGDAGEDDYAGTQTVGIVLDGAGITISVAEVGVSDVTDSQVNGHRIALISEMAFTIGDGLTCDADDLGGALHPAATTPQPSNSGMVHGTVAKDK